MPRPKTPEIVLATWPERTGPAYFGDTPPYPYFGASCDSIWLSFRAVDPDYGYLSGATMDAVSHLGLWVWINDDGTLSSEPRLHGIHSLTLSGAEADLKLLRWACKRVEGVPLAARNTVGNAANALSVILWDALGIRRAIEYRGIGQNETFCPVSGALRHIVKEIERRHAAIAPRKTPAQQEN